MRYKVIMLCGVLAPIVYVVAVILGGSLRPGYSHVSQAVSELIAAGAPNKSLLDPLFVIYNLLTVAFGTSLFRRLRTENQRRGSVVGTLGALFLVAEGLFGFITLYFPQDPGGVLITFTGTMHIVLAGTCSLTSMFTILLMGFWFRSLPHLRGYGIYSFISVIAVFLSGGLTVLCVASNSPVGGLIERITIGGFLEWLFVIALLMASNPASTLCRSRSVS